MTARTSRTALLATALLAAGAAPADGATPPDALWYAVMMDDAKVGYRKQTRTVADGKVTSTADVTMTVIRSGTRLKIRIAETVIETPDGEPLSFRVSQDLGILATTTEGRIRDGQLTLTATHGGRKTTRTMAWPEGALLSEGLRQLQQRKGLKPGTTYTASIFDISASAAREVSFHVGEKKTLDLFGRVVELTEVTATRQTQFGKITTVRYVDESFTSLKATVPALGMNMVMVACPKPVALAADNPPDLLKRVTVACPEPDDDPRSAGAVTFRLRPSGKRKLALPETDSQRIETRDDGAVVVTVRPVAAPDGVAPGYDGDGERAQAALKPSQYVESDAETVVALSREAVGDATDAAEAARRIETFVRTHIKAKTLSVGYASAAEVAEAREGDCTEHAVLTAGLCRAAGMPAEVVSGVVYVPRFGGREHVLIPHAWCRVLIGETWVGLDAAFADGVDAARIALAGGNGDPDSFFDMLPTLGYFDVVEMTLGE
ncbi:MAG: transglutaminase domain-containing protein [Phycisphaerae bacterium]|nr:transglutaminase domain-containing protein [Phycisphaerae bacterium]